MVPTSPEKFRQTGGIGRRERRVGYDGGAQELSDGSLFSEKDEHWRGEALGAASP